MRILLVEDNPGDAALLRRYLDEKGPECELEIVDMLQSGIDRLYQGGIDVVILDLSLPDSTGLDTLKKVKEYFNTIPVIVLTGSEDEETGASAVNEGAQDYLIKGQIDGDILRRAIRYSVERQKTETKLRHQSITDSLTSLYNRRGFEVVAKQQAKVAVREKRALWLIYADLDDLKKINDTFGHQEGDRAIVHAAGILQASCRNSDIVARMGGDEFAVLLINSDDENAANFQARLMKNLDTFNAEKEGKAKISFSLGMAKFDPDKPGISIEGLLSKADQAMYADKMAKKNA